MIAQLERENDDEVKKKDFCRDEFNNNARKVDENERAKSDSDAKANELASAMDELSKAVEELKAEIVELQVQAKRAGEEREAANKDFQTTVSDQRATQKLLAAALDVLKAFYDNQGSFTQLRSGAHAAQQRAGPPPPPGFKAYTKKSSGGVTGTISAIITDAKALETEAVHAEVHSQKAYE